MSQNEGQNSPVKKPPKLLDELFKNLPFSLLGELIAAGCYVNVVYIEKSIFLTNWVILECLVVIIQFVVQTTYNVKALRLPIDYRWAYYLTLPLSFITLSSLSLFYTYNNPTLILVIGIAYVAVSSGGSLFHCYLKHIHVLYITSIFSSYALVCFIQGGIFTYLGFASIIYAFTMIFASIQIHHYLTISFVMAEDKEEQLKKIFLAKKLLNSKHKELTIEEHKQKQLEKELLKLNDKLITNQLSILEQNDSRKTLLGLIYNSVDLIIFKTNRHKEITHFNEHFINTFKIKNAQEQGAFAQSFLNHIPKGHPLRRFFPYTTSELNSFIAVETDDGKYLECTVQLLKSAESITNLWFIRDITEQLQQEKTIVQMINYDDLTALPNRFSLQNKLQLFTQNALANNKLFALAFIDINDFKLINDSLGHGIGNEILKLFASRLKQNIREIDFVGRLGGDEFICIFNELTYKSDADLLISRLKAGLEEPITLNNKTMIVNASIGVSFYPCDTTSIDELISFADIAMYRAKENSNSIYERFLPQYTEQVNQMHVVGQELKSALVHNSFYLVYQPIYETTTHQIAKVEVLLRWRGHALPSVFIPLAERLGLIHDIGLWVLKEACKARYELSKLPELADSDIQFSVNISSQQLRTQKQINELLEQVANSSCKPEWLEFELTESTLVDLDKAIAFIDTLKSLGISVAIDDFGTGFSSLSYLKNIHFDVIKIDKYFLANIFDIPREMNIFQAIIHLAHMLEAKITIEGVETKEQYDYCVQAKCQFIQGFYMSRPIEFVILIEKLTDAVLSKNSAQNRISEAKEG